MKRLLAIAVGGIACLAAGCSSFQSRPDVSRYQLNSSNIRLTLPQGLRIKVGGVNGALPYSETGIAYQVSPYRLDSYRFNRWVSPPTEMVRQELVELTSPPSNGIIRENSGKVLVLSAYIKAFQEVDQGQQRQGLVAIQYCLAPEASPSASVWCITSQHQDASATDTPEGTVAAINTSFGQTLGDLKSSLEANAQALLKSSDTAQARM